MPAKPRRILLSLEVQPAGRLCSCKRDGRSITKGELRLVVKAPGPATGKQGYCIECSLMMIEAARADLRALAVSLEAGRANITS
jgi:hypothetical protein